MNNDDLKLDIIMRHFAKKLEGAVASQGDDIIIAYYKGVLQGIAASKHAILVSIETVARIFGDKDNEQSE